MHKGRKLLVAHLLDRIFVQTLDAVYVACNDCRFADRIVCAFEICGFAFNICNFSSFLFNRTFAGIIDRLDTAVDPETGAVYVKIVDYKSGAKKFDRKAFEAGRQLQLLIYMEAALRAGAKKGKEGKYQGAGEDAGSGALREILPAALFFSYAQGR